MWSAGGSTRANGVAFTGEGKLVRKATGYEQEKLKPRYPTSGSRAARAELPAPIGAYRWPTDFFDGPKFSTSIKSWLCVRSTCVNRIRRRSGDRVSPPK